MKLHHYLLRRLFLRISKGDAPAPAFNPGSVRNILLVNTTAIGDTVLSTPAIRAINESMPAAAITALVSSSAREALRSNPRIKNFIKHPGKVNLKYLLRLPSLVRKLRAGAFDLVIVLHANDPDAGPLSYMTGAHWRMGWKESNFAFLFTLPVETKTPGVHGIDIKLSYLEKYGIRPAGRQMEFFPSREDIEEADRFLKGGKGPFAAIYPFGSKTVRWWPGAHVEKFARSLRGLGFMPIIMGGPKEAEIAEGMASASGAISAAGKLSLGASAALISKSAFFVSTDSGLLHIAQALKVRTIAMFGSADRSLTGPVNEGDIVVQKKLECVPCRKHACKYEVVKCMEAIKPEEVLEFVREVSKHMHPGL